MQCQTSTPLDDIQLLSYLDGEAGPEVIAHLRTCPACRQRAETLAHTQAVLRAYSFRTSCPSPDELRDFHFHLLPATRYTAVAHHLDLCPYCTRELVADYAEFPTGAAAGREGRGAPSRDADAGLRGLIAQVRLLVATLLDSGLAPAPAYALRGDAHAARPARTHLFQVDDSMISLVVQPDPDLPDRLAIEGQALLADLPTDAPSMQVHLWQAERLAALCVLDAAGDFAINRLTPGQYELILSSPRTKIKLPGFTVGLDDAHVD